MNKKLAKLLICGSFITTGASLVAEPGLKQHDGMKHKNHTTHTSDVDYPVRNNVYEQDNSSANSLEMQANNRFRHWGNVMGLNQARYDRFGEQNDDAEKAMAKMDENLNTWERHQTKLRGTTSDKEREKAAKEIAKIDRILVVQQQEFDRQVPRDSVDYKGELKATISQIEAAEEDLENRLAFLNQREEILEEIQDELDEIKEEANDHLAEIEDMDDDSEWAELKSDIDVWMNNNLNLDG